MDHYLRHDRNILRQGDIAERVTFKMWYFLWYLYGQHPKGAPVIMAAEALDDHKSAVNSKVTSTRARKSKFDDDSSA